MTENGFNCAVTTEIFHCKTQINRPVIYLCALLYVASINHFYPSVLPPHLEVY